VLEGLEAQREGREELELDGARRKGRVGIRNGSKQRPRTRKTPKHVTRHFIICTRWRHQ